MQVQAVDHLVLNVRDVAVSSAWYTRVCGMTRADQTVGDGAVRTSVQFGVQKINLRPVDASQADWFTGAAPMPGSADLCFLVDLAPEEVVGHLRAHDVAVELGPITRSGARGAIRSVYCRDPDGNLIEFSSYG
jgi:catechol 2,3-dioxygenase-like lactoylglutathione lyase family enzyme